MSVAARLIGGAGTGKTTELLRILEGVLARGVSPWEVGFVSFTRTARREASSRAAVLADVAAGDLEQAGYFKTLHSICYHALGQRSDGLLTSDKKSREWIEEAVDLPIGESLVNPLIDDDYGAFDASTSASTVLSIWHMARARLESLGGAWDRAHRSGVETMPSFEESVSIVDQYEQAKRLDGRSDFTDLLGRFAGWSFGIEGHERIAPDGESPNLHVWIHDECQDTSGLAMSVFERLIEGAEWVYLAGDPFQSVYQFAGADPSLFLKFPVAKERIMPRSYRCAAPILELGENILRDASDYWDRGIAPADHEGEVDQQRYNKMLLEELLRPNDTESWLLLARTNYHASRMSRRLDDVSIPWRSTKGRGGWGKSAKQECLTLLHGLGLALNGGEGGTITASQWCKVLKSLPAGKGENAALERGTKTKWEDKEHRPDDEARKNVVDLGQWGATQHLLTKLLNGSWIELINGAREFVTAVAGWGLEATRNPRIRVGTIHSAKGSEADNVLWLTTGSKAITSACEDAEAHDSECRVGYVAATRARKRLIVASEPNQRHRWKVPA